MIIKKQTMYFRRWLLIIWSTGPAETGASLHQAKHREHGIAAPLPLDIFFLYLKNKNLFINQDQGYPFAS